MLRGILKKVVGDADQREIARLQKVVEQINVLEPVFEPLDDAQLRAKTDEFRDRLAAGETVDGILVEAFAAVREAAKRTVGMRHYDVQLIGGIILHHSTYGTSQFDVRRCTFQGGGVTVSGPSTVTVEDCEIRGAGTGYRDSFSTGSSTLRNILV